MLRTTLQKIIDKQQQSITVKPTYVGRDLQLKPANLSSHALVISGIRRCGKSSLQQHLRSGFKNSLLLNFEDTRLYNFVVDDFEKLYSIIEERKYKALFFDEIQIVKGWELFVRQLLDEGFKVCVTGSNASLLSKELGTKLTGRHLTKELFPFNYKEYLALTKQKRTEKTLRKHLEDGGFPEYLQTKDQEILQNLFTDILVRDIAVRFGIRDVKSLQNLASFLVSNVSKRVTAPKLKSLLQIKATSTVLEYLSYLEQAWLFFFIPKYSHSLKAQAVNPKKVYCIDNGLINANSKSFSEDFGRKLENFVFLELRRKGLQIFYFADKSECDFVAFKNNKIVGVWQVCTTVDEDNLDREVNGAIEALAFFGLKKGKIITLNQKDVVKKDGFEISLVPLLEFIK